MAELCPCCGRKLPAAKAPIVATPVDTARMSDRELFAHYKRIAPIEDLRFFLRCAFMSDALRADAEMLLARTLVKVPPTYKAEYKRLKERWRIEQRAAEDAYNRTHKVRDAFDRWIDPPVAEEVA